MGHSIRAAWLRLVFLYELLHRQLRIEEKTSPPQSSPQLLAPHHGQHRRIQARQGEPDAPGGSIRRAESSPSIRALLSITTTLG